MKAEFSERAKKNQSIVIKTVERITGKEIAQRMDASDSTVSRFKNGELAEWSAFLACAGLKIVPTDARCYPPHIAEAMLAFTKHNVSRIKTVDELAEDDPE